MTKTNERHVGMCYPRDYNSPISAVITGEQRTFDSYADIAAYASDSGFSIGTARGLVKALDHVHCAVSGVIGDAEINSAFSGCIEALDTLLHDIDTDRHVIEMAARQLQHRIQRKECVEEAEAAHEAERERLRTEGASDSDATVSDQDTSCATDCTR